MISVHPDDYEEYHCEDEKQEGDEPGEVVLDENNGNSRRQRLCHKGLLFMLFEVVGDGHMAPGQLSLVLGDSAAKK